MKYLKVFEDYNLESELNECISGFYTISATGTIDVDGSVHLHGRKLTKLPFKFGKVSGDFQCNYNSLTSLDGCPTEVGRSFDCSHNKLTSLNGCPEEVGGGFYCRNNSLTSLDKGPLEVGGDFDCSYNKLTSLGMVTNINKNIYCIGNNIDPNNNGFMGYCSGNIRYYL